MVLPGYLRIGGQAVHGRWREAGLTCLRKWEFGLSSKDLRPDARGGFRRRLAGRHALDRSLAPHAVGTSLMGSAGVAGPACRDSFRTTLPFALSVPSYRHFEPKAAGKGRRHAP